MYTSVKEVRHKINLEHEYPQMFMVISLKCQIHLHMTFGPVLPHVEHLLQLLPFFHKNAVPRADALLPWSPPGCACKHVLYTPYTAVALYAAYCPHQ